MRAFFEFAENFLITLSAVGDFLLLRPFDGLRFVPSGDFVADGVLGFLIPSIASSSIGELMFGAGLVGILTFKFVKFFTDLVL